MHNLKVRPPCAHLKPYVRAFAQRTLNANDSTVIEPVPAQLEQLIDFDFVTLSEVWHLNGQIQFNNCVTVAGAQTRFAAPMHLSGGVDAFGIFFLPAGAALSRPYVRACKSCRGYQHAGQTAGARSQGSLRGKLLFEDRVLIAEKFLLHRAARAIPFDEMVLAVNYLFQKRGAVRISHLAGNSTSGLRHFERKFLRATGANGENFCAGRSISRSTGCQACLSRPHVAQHCPLCRLSRPDAYDS